MLRLLRKCLQQTTPTSDVSSRKQTTTDTDTPTSVADDLDCDVIRVDVTSSTSAVVSSLTLALMSSPRTYRDTG